ncbi:hypothetical protein Clacol_008233 [Clathrus columnatus]|uniref:Uncharacterized protein n=1 Tax=Clathrus columnatus TaxID=1419009 RepID=A0AAV5AM33_9AGAM|nr:hypothetical protein Clacol_008233 [Clathrus columnatus]
MTSPLKPPLVPLPSSTTSEQIIQHDPNDLFESLLTTEDSVFQSQRPRGERRGTFSSLNSDFGAFVSVPASEEAKEHPLLDHDEVLPQTEMKPKVSVFFDQIAGEAKKNNERNEQRVMNTILKHEQNPLLWPKQSDHDTSPLSCLNPSQSPSNFNSQSHATTASSPSIVSQTFSERLDPWVSTTAHNNDHLTTLSNATFTRKWMSSLLNTSIPAVLPYALNHESVKPQPQRKSALPQVTHVSPFAPHTFVPPSGAPGFAGDYSWNQSGFDFNDNDPHLRRLKLEGRRESTSPILTLDLAEQIDKVVDFTLQSGPAWDIVANSVYPMFLWKSINQGNVEVFKWSGKNEYVAFCDKDFISFGGG